MEARYTGYAVCSELCRVYVFESDYSDIRDARRNVGRCICELEGIDGLSFQVEAFGIGTPRGELVWELAEEAASDGVGDVAGDVVNAFELVRDVVEVTSRPRSIVGELHSAFGIPRAALERLWAAYQEAEGAFDPASCEQRFSALVERMAAYTTG